MTFYNIEFQDGTELEYAINMITECMWTQADLEGNQFLFLDSIVDHQKDDKATNKTDGFITHTHKDRNSKEQQKNGGCASNGRMR
jgi:hypothetical protein